MNVIQDALTSDIRLKAEDRVKSILKKHYPHLDVNDTDALVKIIESENLHIHYSDPNITFSDTDSDNITVTCEMQVKVMKELT